jgi:hypothetical protein
LNTYKSQAVGQLRCYHAGIFFTVPDHKEL